MFPKICQLQIKHPSRPLILDLCFGLYTHTHTHRASSWQYHLITRRESAWRDDEMWQSTYRSTSEPQTVPTASSDSDLHSTPAVVLFLCPGEWLAQWWFSNLFLKMIENNTKLGVNIWKVPWQWTTLEFLLHPPLGVTVCLVNDTWTEVPCETSLKSP